MIGRDRAHSNIRDATGRSGHGRLQAHAGAELIRDPAPEAAGSWRVETEARTLDLGLEAALGALPLRRHRPGRESEHAVHLRPLFRAQVASRQLDFASRWLQSVGAGYYTIGSAGHEANAALGLLSAVTDPALLHYRSGGFYAARAQRAGLADPSGDVLRGCVAAAADPISGGRHKVFGHPELHVIPQTSTIASHLPRATGLGFSLGLAARLDRPTPWPRDALVICSLGDASLNHSTALGALNAAAYLAHRGIPCPVLFVCEDNGRGISTPSPPGWVERALRSVPGLRYARADGMDPLGLLATTEAALTRVRERRAPGILHLSTVRYLGHAGADVELAYRPAAEMRADGARDPILHTAQAIVSERRGTPDELLREYRDIRAQTMRRARAVLGERQLTERADIVRPIAYPDRTRSSPAVAHAAAVGSGHLVESRSVVESAEPVHAAGLRAVGEAAAPPVRTVAQAINAALEAVLAEEPGALVFGEDVGRKGGVYGITRGLQRRFGAARVFDTLLDEQTILGTALGAALAGFLPIPEIQYLAYLHNAEDQLRGEAASLPFFSNGQYRNGMVVRLPGLASPRGFGGHFHNDNSLAVLRDIPGLVLAVPSTPADAAGMLRTCVDLARDEGRVCVFVEPIARYHTRDLLPGDGAWIAAVDPGARTGFGEVAATGAGDDLLIVTYGNGHYLSRRAMHRLAAEGVHARVLDLRWLLPLPVDEVVRAARTSQRVLIVDETRASGGVGDALAAAVAGARPRARVACVSAADTFVPLGPAADAVLVGEDEIVRCARWLVSGPGERPRREAP